MASKRRADSADESSSKVGKKDAFNARIVAAGDKLNLVAADPQGQTQCPAEDNLFGGDYTRNAPELGTLFIQDNSAPTTECYEATENVRDFTETPFSQQTINDRDRIILNDIPAFVNVSFENWRNDERVETLMKKLIGADVSNALKEHFGTKEAMRAYNRIRIEFPGLIEPVVLTKSDSDKWIMNTFPTGLDMLIKNYNYGIRSPQFDRTEGSTIIMKSENPDIVGSDEDEYTSDEDEVEEPDERSPIRYYLDFDPFGSYDHGMNHDTYAFQPAGPPFQENIFAAQNDIDWQEIGDEDFVDVDTIGLPSRENGNVSFNHWTDREQDNATEFWRAELGDDYVLDEEQQYTFADLVALMNKYPGRAFRVEYGSKKAVLVAAQRGISPPDHAGHDDSDEDDSEVEEPDERPPIEYFRDIEDDIYAFQAAGSPFRGNIFAAINDIDWDTVGTVYVQTARRPENGVWTDSDERAYRIGEQIFWMAELAGNYVEGEMPEYSPAGLEFLLNKYPGRVFEVSYEYGNARAVLVAA